MKICNRCCTNKAIKGRRICYKCRYIEQNQKDPIKVAYYRLKGHAKARNKDFDLTLEDFKTFCIKTDYINKRGISGEAYHIDRIEEHIGYNKDNIQLLTNVDNIKKYIEFCGYDENGKRLFRTRTIKQTPSQPDDDCPF